MVLLLCFQINKLRVNAKIIIIQFGVGWNVKKQKHFFVNNKKDVTNCSYISKLFIKPALFNQNTRVVKATAASNYAFQIL